MWRHARCRHRIAQRKAYLDGAIHQNPKMQAWHMTVEDMIRQIQDAVEVQLQEHQRAYRDPNGSYPDAPDPAPELIRYVKIHVAIKEAKRQYDLAQIAANAKRPRDSQST